MLIEIARSAIHTPCTLAGLSAAGSRRSGRLSAGARHERSALAWDHGREPNRQRSPLNDELSALWADFDPEPFLETSIADQSLTARGAVPQGRGRHMVWRS